MGWRHSVPLALSALPTGRGGAQGAVGVNRQTKPQPAAPKEGTGPQGTYGARGPINRQRRRRRLAGGAHSECALCRERAAQFLCKDRSKQAAPSPVPQRQRRRKETQWSTPSVRASLIDNYRPCAQACVIYYFPPAHHPLLVVAAAAAQQCSAIRSSGIWGGLGHRRRLSSRSPSPAPFVARARGCGALGS